MRAAVIEADGVLAVRDIPEPEIGDYDALVDMLYGATCTGTDLALIAGTLPFRAALPTVLGHESVGRVAAVGPKVRHLRPGDLVTRVGTPPAAGYTISWGGFAERGIAKDFRAMDEDGVSTAPWPDARRNRVLPEGTDPRAAPMIITWRETLSYLTRMGLKAGHTLLVMGSGGNGLAYAAHAANLGAARVAMVGAAGREETARRAGVTDYVAHDAPDLAERLGAVSGAGFDFVLDAVGKRGSADTGMRFLKPGGVLGIYGLSDFGQAAIHPLNARGTFTCYNGGYEEAETHEQVMVFIEAGRLDASIWLDLAHPFPLERIHEAFEALRARKLVKALIQLS